MTGMGLATVTMVFCSVDGGKAFATRHRSSAKEVHAELVAVMRNALRSVCT